jgi:hypothetical protein
MRDALILSGVLLAIVLLTHVGRRKENLFLMITPFLTATGIGGAILADMSPSTSDVVAGVVGTAIGVGIGIGLSRLTAVEWDPDRRAVYTRAGWGYLGLWLVVLVGRLIFVYVLEHDATFARHFGEFLADTGIDADGVALFFVAMALTMVVVRTIGVWIGRAAAMRTADATH